MSGDTRWPNRAGGGAEVRWEVPTAELLHELIAAPLPLGLKQGALEHGFHRDAFLDTEDGLLRDQRVTCRFRLTSEDRRLLTLSIRGPAVRGNAAAVMWQRYDAPIEEVDSLLAVRGNSEPARRLRAFVDPEQLQVHLVLSTERYIRRSMPGWLRRAEFEFVYDLASFERGPLRRRFCELKMRRLAGGRPTLATVAQALQAEYRLRPTIAAKLDRARRLSLGLEHESVRRSLDGGGSVALVVVDRGRVACRRLESELRLPIGAGSGEATARHLLVEFFGTSVGELRLLGVIPAAATRARLEVWLATRQRRDRDVQGGIQWLPMDELTARAGTPSLADAQTIAALLFAARSDALTPRTPTSVRAIAMPPDAPPPSLGAAAQREATPTSDLADEPTAASPRLLDADRSLLEFTSRVLAMAEDPRTPLLERLRYLGIASANLDEFFMVRVSALKRRAIEITGERSVRERTPDEQLADLRLRIEDLITRQERCCADCLADLATHHGVRVARLDDLDSIAHLELQRHFRRAILPALTPHAMTEAPGFPTPLIASGALSILVIVKDPQTGPLHLTTLRIPPSLPRFIQVPQSEALVPIEEIARDEVDQLFPGRAVLQAFVFRVTRAAELDVNEAESGNLLQAIEEDARRRRGNAIVRVEVERAMPQHVRTMLLDELRFDIGGDALPLGAVDIYETAGLLDLTALRELAALPKPALAFPVFEARTPFASESSMFDLLRQGDQLVHHPYDDFNASVLRFLEEAADDPGVITIKATLYRAGERSPIVDALLRAAQSGKEVVTFVELKARFDEERNAVWARRLTNAGVHVIYGLVGLKNHAKMLLVTRRENGVVRRYAHVGTGNYHAATARLYTDLGLFTANDHLTADVSDLFNELTGSSGWPRGRYRQILVAPHQLLRALLERIEREAAHARAGRPARIRLKINGLSDVELIVALYGASMAGVEIDLIVRGICCLRPGVPGFSDRIRVVSIVGRFLEHARIYYFANGGDEEYFIGSADWRARNLRRRVEVVVPVDDATCRKRLALILERELADPSAWHLRPDGSYARTSPPPTAGSTAQLATIADVESAREAAVW